MRLRGKNIPLILFTDLALFFYFYLLNRALNPFKIFSENDTTGSLFERGLPGDTLYPFALVVPIGLPFFAIIILSNLYGARMLLHSFKSTDFHCSFVYTLRSCFMSTSSGINCSILLLYTFFNHTHHKE